MTRDRAGRIAATTVAAILPLGFLAIFFALPVAGMLARGFAPGGVLDLGGFAEVLGRARTQRIIGFTLAISAAATVISVVVGVPVAHALYRLALPGRRTLRAIVAMPFVLPTVVVGVMFRSLLAEGGALGGLGLDGEWGGILAAFVFFNLAVVVRTVGAAWEGLDRRPEEAAGTLGAGPATVFRTVTLPALAPSIISAASIVFLFCATAFGVVLTMGGLAYGTVETEIYLLTTALFDLRGAAVLSVVQLVAVVAMLLLADRARSRDAGTQRAAKSAIAPGRVTAYAMGSVIATVLAVAFVAVPVLALVVRSLRRQGEWTLDYYLALGRVGGADGRSALPVTVWEALGTSWRIAIDATILAVVLGLLVAVLVSRPARSPGGLRWRRLLDGVVMLPLGVSAVTVGFGFLITLDRPPLDLRTSPVLIPIAQAIVALPLVVRTLAPVLRAIDDRQRQVAATLGARPWQVLATVDLPIIWRPLLAAVGLALAVSLGEFGATSFLARPDSPTLPVVIYRLIGRPGVDNLGMALAASVILAVVTVTVMGVVERLRVSSVGAF
ncbi:MAG TPA: ABC transporter permease subunit [Dermatophilaceae bacterium]|nr:ABC transporter permease subunit [Dermatophilaceae bacterium]HOR16864.1 ABC transporter permease subunit [Dermatophilaceae bacterium]HRC65252.1 ABC transporter permease subunit [Dermatophilaceae bacterium]